MRAVLAQAGGPTVIHGVLHPGAPSQAVVVARNGLDDHGYVEPGQTLQLLTHYERLQLALAGNRDMLEVAATTQVRSGERTGSLDPVGRGSEDLDGVAAQELGLVVALRDLHDHLLVGERVTNEDHPTLVSSDKVTLMRDRADLDGVPLTRQGTAPRAPAACATGHPRSPGRSSSGSLSTLP